MDTKIILLLISCSKDFFCASLLIFHLVASTAPPVAAALTRQDCKPATCGKLNITYPFWLDGTQASECGYPTFNITCSSNKTSLLSLFGHNFNLKNIFYHNQSILLSAAEFVDDPCRLPYYNLTYDSYPLSYSASNKQVVFLFNCSGSTQTQAKYKPVTCALYGRPAYYGGDYNAYLDQPSPGCEAAIVPVLSYSNTSTAANYSVALRHGWLMDWTVQDCDECFNSGGTCGYKSSTASFECFCSDQVLEKFCIVAGHNARLSKSMKNILEVAAVLVSLSLLCLFLCLYLKHYKRSHGHHMQRVETFLKEHASLTPKRYKYSEVKKMTKFFRNKLGQGGYGTVYKGSLPDGHIVAVKVLIASKGDGQEFVNEVTSISRTSHVNIVNLVGFCIEGSKRALIYDFMPNGSLEKFISYEKEEESKLGLSLDWKKLHQIAVGIARGLEYLHQGCNTRIVHFDIKPHNILLDQDFCPKISDFGLAKLGRPKESKISMTAARGTIGYIAPEVFSRNFGAVSSKSDVYSYGMMVLEMVGAKRRIAEAVDCSSETYFPHCIYDNLDEYCNVDNLNFQSDQNNKELVRKMIIVGLWCIQIVSASRPTMSMVVDMLEGNEDLHMPPRP